MRIALAGEGAIASKHADALARIDEVRVVALIGGDAAATQRFAEEHGIPHWSTDLDVCLDEPTVDAIVLATPTPIHAQQAIAALEADKHVLVEIPMADSLADSKRVVEAADQAQRVAMVCHTRRFNPGHQWLNRRFRTGELQLQHLIVSTVFLRRENLNARGEPRTWTDDLLWHHACHTVDLFQHQVGEPPSRTLAFQGPAHPELGIAMDMCVGLQAPNGALCTLALSFNHDGPFGSTFRYVCDGGTYVAHYDDLVDGHGSAVDLTPIAPSPDGIERQDREFVAAILEGREPRSSVRSALPAMETLDRLERQLRDGGGDAG